jgi:hypothetical protein
MPNFVPKVQGRGFEPPLTDLKSAFLPLEDPCIFYRKEEDAGIEPARTGPDPELARQDIPLITV